MTSPLDDARALSREPAPVLEGYPATSAPGALGDLARWLAGLPGADPDRPDARLRRPICAVYVSSAADAGPSAVDEARTLLEALSSPAAAAPRMAKALGAGLEAYDLALARPAPDGAEAATMRPRDCAATLAFGMEALAKFPDLLVLGCAAPGVERRAARLACALLGGDAEAWGGDDPRRAEAVARARATAGEDPLSLVAELAGREIAAAVGALLAARAQATPVLLDGEGALAAAAAVFALDRAALAHVRLSRRPVTVAGEHMTAALGLVSVLADGSTGAPGMDGLAATAVARVAADLNAAAG